MISTCGCTRNWGDFPNHIDSEEEALQWLESILYEFFEIQPDSRDREDILAKRISEERATTLFFEIEDRLGIQDADWRSGQGTGVLGKGGSKEASVDYC